MRGIFFLQSLAALQHCSASESKYVMRRIVSWSIVEIPYSIDMDRLEPFFEKFLLTARMFYSGQLCGISEDQNRSRLAISMC